MYSGRGSLGERGFLLAHSSRLQSILVRKAQQHEPETAVDSTAIVKQRAQKCVCKLALGSLTPLTQVRTACPCNGVTHSGWDLSPIQTCN